MLFANPDPAHRQPLDPADAAILDPAAADDVARYLAYRPDHAPTPLRALPALAAACGVAAIHVKDESSRFGLGSFKALGGAYAVVRLVLEEAARRFGRPVGYEAMTAPDVRAVARTMTVACATDGNHGRSVAQGAQLIGARCAIFVHAGVSDVRVAAIARFGAEMIRVDGTYDDAVTEATRVAAARGWLIVSDTSWPGYERIPGLVMQGYTAMMREAVQALGEPPSHVFMQAGVGGLAAAAAGYLAQHYGADRPTFVVVEPDRAACLYETARAGHLVKVPHGAPTVMAMLECYEPSLIAWRVLSRTADAFMTVGEDDAVAMMNRLARPRRQDPAIVDPAIADPAIVAGESGGAGLAGLARIAGDAAARTAIGLGADARVFAINTEGATDPVLYRTLTGLDPASVVKES
ncbi:diaminopropionate ammonia-lyase [Aliidongia dinghuensis]|uniref:Diaminopropionate ammonia-lyase n=1 Tax=Aliidongia dinghuensis TaxID=1867774 RepID=A0A8J2YRL1_9PROT|nr:diaminopropionate ammonia-lyase [Aliidongia dinghuensis]GGF06598.1 diaminopropionate ammonia-lyase [Aliidongia dinghuensis]